MKKRILTAILVGFFAFIGCFTPLVGITKVSADTSDAIPIDMYLLGGQSNAVGCSEIGYSPTKTYENIWYAGEIERAVKLKNSGTENEEAGEPEYEITAAQSWVESFSDFKLYVSAGMGYHSSSIGPEYGMAKIFNNQYEGEERRAIIFKTAYGGSFLHDVATSANWASPSTWREGYKPDPDKPVSTFNRTGLLYQRFIDNFERVYNELKANGYQPIVKGMAWMQGEADAGDSTAKMFYFNNLKAFIQDIRIDIAKITGDEKMNEMPFVIGKIAKTFMKYNNPDTTAINEVQQVVADQMENVYAIDTDDLILVRADGKINGSGGWDTCHYNFKDMVKLGERFAETFNEVDAKNGKSGCASTINAFPQVIIVSLFSVMLLCVVGKYRREANN